MSNPTSTLQLLGGLLSMTSSTGAKGMLSLENQEAMSVSDDFYSLWMGLTQPLQGDASLENLERQAMAQTMSDEGSKLPLEVSDKLLSQLQQMLNEQDTDDVLDLEDAITAIKASIKDMLANPAEESAKLSVPELNPIENESKSEEVEITDEALLALFNWMQRESSNDSGLLIKSDSVGDTEQKQEAQANLVALVIAYLDQQVRESNAEKTDKELALQQALSQREAKERLDQLWQELAIAKANKLAEKEAQKLNNKAASTDRVEGLNADNQDQERRVAEAIAMRIASEAVSDESRTQTEKEVLRQDALARIMTEQSRASSSDAIAPQNTTSASQTVAPFVAPVQTIPSGKQSDAQLESRKGVIPPVPLMATSVQTEMTPAERLIASDTMQEPNRRVLTDALNQAVSSGRVDESNQESLRRFEASATSSSIMNDAIKMVQSPASPAQSPVAQAHNAQDALMQKMLNPAWSRALGERAVMMAQQGPRMAEVRLDPPELGSLRIRVQVHGSDQVSLTFNAPNASVREVLEQSLPRLREMFAEQGMNLADASVSDQSAEQSSEQTQARHSMNEDATAAEEEFGEVPANRSTLRKVGIIDYYA